MPLLLTRRLLQFAAVVHLCGTGLAHGGTFRGWQDYREPLSFPDDRGLAATDPTIPGNPATRPASRALPAVPEAAWLASSGWDLAAWRNWWAFNCDIYLREIASLNAPAPTPASDVTNTRRDAARRLRGVLRDESILSLLVNTPARSPAGPFRETPVIGPPAPAVPEKVTEQQASAELIAATLIALAKIGVDAEQTSCDIHRFLNCPNQTVRESAILALGILGRDSDVSTLVDIFLDVEEHYRSRTFSAVASGLLAARTSDAQLRRQVQSVYVFFLDGEGSRRAPRPEIRMAVILAMGLVPDPERISVACLERYFAFDWKRNPEIAAHAIRSIARLVHEAPATVREKWILEWLLLAQNMSRKSRESLEVSTVQALGEITRLSDPVAPLVIDYLKSLDIRRSQATILPSLFSLLALGEIAATDSTSTEIDNYLIAKLTAPAGHPVARSFTALALGITSANRRRVNVHSTCNPDVVKSLLGMLQMTNNPEQLAAYSIALGLMRANDTEGELIRVYKRVRDKTWRGCALVALAMSGSTQVQTLLTMPFESLIQNPDMLRESMTAARLEWSDSSALRAMEILTARSPLTRFSFASAARVFCAPQALRGGFLNKRFEINNYGTLQISGSLMDLLGDARVPTFNRAFVAAAIGNACDKDTVPWNHGLLENINYCSLAEALFDPQLGIGLLELH